MGMATSLGAAYGVGGGGGGRTGSGGIWVSRIPNAAQTFANGTDV